MTSIIQRHYDGLAAGVLRGHRCSECGWITFPMTTCCTECGCWDWEDVDLAGTGELLFVSHNVAPATNPRYEDLAPYVFGHVMLDEGIVAQGIVRGVEPTPEAIAELFERLPVRVRAVPFQADDLSVLAFELEE